MIIVDNLLAKREAGNNPIKVGIIGTGEMGKGIINQITRYTPGVTVTTVFNRRVQKAVDALETAGIRKYTIADETGPFNAAIDSGVPIITNDIDLLLQADGIDLLIEVTGTIQFAAQTILNAFRHGKNVLSFNVEVDATFGPLFKRKAKEYGVLYGVSDGDQPGVTLNLYRFVKGMGFEPLLCGNIKGMQDHYRNPETQKGFAEKWGMTPEMATNFADGTKISFEQACIANATNMKVAQRGMLGYSSEEHVDNLTQLYDIEQLREMGGIVDYIVGAKPSPGVFIYAAAKDPFSIRYLDYSKMGQGPLYSFYVPYHLLFFEIAGSIGRLVDFKDPVVSPLSGPVVEVCAAAKVNLSPGTRLDGLGGFKTYGVCENTDIARSENLLPMGLAQGAVVKKSVQTDRVLSFDDIEIDSESPLLKLFTEQCRLFDRKP